MSPRVKLHPNPTNQPTAHQANQLARDSRRARVRHIFLSHRRRLFLPTDLVFSGAAVAASSSSHPSNPKTYLYFCAG